MGPIRADQGVDHQAVPLLRPLHGCEHLPKPLPLKPESPQTERAGRSSWEYFHTLLHPLRLSPGLSSTGLEEPWKGKHAGTSLVQHQCPLDLSFLCQPQQVADIHLPELGPQKAPRGAPPESLIPPLPSALFPSPCPGSSLAEPLQIQANSDPRDLPNKTGSQWRCRVLSGTKTVQAESRAHGEILQSPLRPC